MALTQKNTGDTGAASDHNEAYELFKTTNAKEWITFTHKGADLTAAGTLSLGGDGNYFDVVGTTGITAISARNAGTFIILQFDGAVTLTHNATTLSLLGGADYTTAAGDRLLFISDASGNWRELGRGMFTGGGYVTLNGTETLTNKTLTSPVLTTPRVAPTGFGSMNHSHASLNAGGLIAESGLNITDVTTWNVSNTAHGFAPKSTGSINVYLRGDASWATISSNVVVEHLAHEIATSETTTSTSFTDLSTPGPTVTTGTATANDRVSAWFTCQSSNNSATGGMVVAPKLDAVATDIDNGTAVDEDASVANQTLPLTYVKTFTGLSAATHTILTQYEVTTGGTGTFRRRKMIVQRVTA